MVAREGRQVMGLILSWELSRRGWSKELITVKDWGIQGYVEVEEVGGSVRASGFVVSVRSKWKRKKR